MYYTFQIRPDRFLCVSSPDITNEFLFHGWLGTYYFMTDTIYPLRGQFRDTLYHKSNLLSYVVQTYCLDTAPLEFHGSKFGVLYRPSYSYDSVSEAVKILNEFEVDDLQSGDLFKIISYVHMTKTLDDLMLYLKLAIPIFHSQAPENIYEFYCAYWVQYMHITRYGWDTQGSVK